MVAVAADWELLIERLDLSALVPDAYGPYRRTVHAALKLFLRLLPPARRNEIVAEQISLPPSADIIDRLLHLLRQCPTLHKLGQLLSRHPPLPLDLRHRLRALETHEPRIELAQIAGPVERALQAAGAHICEPVRLLAEGSVAVVAAACFHLTAGAEYDAAIKVLKPGIEQRLEQDLAVWPTVVDFILAEFDNLDVQTPDLHDLLDRVGQLLRREVDLEGERANLVAAHEAYRDMHFVHVPQVYPGGSHEALVMERVDGVKVTHWAPPGTGDAIRMGRQIVNAVVCRPMFALGRPALFHGDPHAGNLLAGPAGELVMLDWSLAPTLSSAQLEQLAQVALGLVMLDAHRVTDAILSLAENTPDGESVRDSVGCFFASLPAAGLPGFSAVHRLLDQVVTQTRVQLPNELLLLRKSMSLVEGVLHDLGAQQVLDYEILRSTCAAMLEEGWRRWWSAPCDRRFSSHLSNADLWTACLTLPLQFTRRWPSIPLPTGKNLITR